MVWAIKALFTIESHSFRRLSHSYSLLLYNWELPSYLWEKTKGISILGSSNHSIVPCSLVQQLVSWRSASEKGAFLFPDSCCFDPQLSQSTRRGSRRQHWARWRPHCLPTTKSSRETDVKFIQMLAIHSCRFTFHESESDVNSRLITKGQWFNHLSRMSSFMTHSRLSQAFNHHVSRIN